MRLVMTTTAVALILLITACDKPDKAAGEEQGFGINKAASGTPTRESPQTNQSGDRAAQPAAPANEKSR